MQKTVPQVLYSRRRSGRIQLNEMVYALWSCRGQDGLSRIRDIGFSGLFIEAAITADVGTPVRLHFLVKEGQIRADAVVRHVKLGRGVGLKFSAINERDLKGFEALIKRLREQGRTAVGESPQTEPAPGDTQSPHIKRILLVDDDRIIRQTIRRSIENELGWICEEADNGVDGISKARAFKPDLVILDLSMPMMNGYHAAKVLNREMPTVPIVMLTMYADAIGKSSTSASIVGVTVTLSKIDGVAALIHRVKNMLGT